MSDELSDEVKAALGAARDEINEVIEEDDSGTALNKLRTISSKLREARARIVAEQDS